MSVCPNAGRINQRRWRVSVSVARPVRVAIAGLLFIFFFGVQGVSAAQGQTPGPDWRAQVRKYAEAQDWDSAVRVVNQQIARAPQDMDIRAWRARVLTWSGKLVEAEKEYREILETTRTDADDWMGLANVCLREGKIQKAQEAIDTAEHLAPKRSDIHAARARILRAAGHGKEAREEFQKALILDPASAEAREGLTPVRNGSKHELRFGQDNDLLNFSGDYHDEWLSEVAQWNSHWTTSVAGDFYQRAGLQAGKFVGSITRRQPAWGALTLGGAIGHDNGVIPKSEAFVDLDHGWKTGETNFVRGVEFAYDQHWYWYQAARILTLNGTTLLYFPREWTFSLGATGARSAFSGAGAEWKPSGVGRLGFPLARWGDRQLSGNVFFAAGTENFAIVDQIGSFASQTYGGGLKFQMNTRQDLTGYAGYQKRTQNRTDTSFGLSYGIHF